MRHKKKNGSKSMRVYYTKKVKNKRLEDTRFARHLRRCYQSPLYEEHSPDLGGGWRTLENNAKGNRLQNRLIL